MADEIKPALTEEEWAGGYTMNAAGCKGALLFDESVCTGYRDFYYGDDYKGKERRGLAALCLYGQPFGFTWEDVDDLRWSAMSAVEEYSDLDRSRRLDNLADRIAALLPPRTLDTSRPGA